MVNNTVSSDVINLQLRQMGASEIRSIGSKLHRVIFDLGEGRSVTYLYHVTRKGRLFLQREEPYAVTKGFFADEKEIVEYIDEDVLMFKNAIKSNSYEDFYDIGKKLSAMVDSLEDMFFYCDVADELLQDISSKLDSIDEDIKHITEISPKIYED